MAVLSFSHQASQAYWKNISYTDLVKDVLSLKMKLIANGIRPVLGYRAPFLQTAGDTTFQVLSENGFRYDSTLPMRKSAEQWWPYTLDYGVRAGDCLFPPCPKCKCPFFIRNTGFERILLFLTVVLG